MPSHTVHSALISLYLDGDGAPWNFSTWQDISGVKHGLFPSNDSLLPPGWTSADRETISSYFSQYDNIPSEDSRIRFASSRVTGGIIPGRDKWRAWVNQNWSKWKIHSRISDILSAKDINPIAMYSNHPELRHKQVSTSYIPVALDDIGAALYGEEALGPSGLLPFSLRMAMQHIVQRTWMTLSKQLSRSRQRLASLEAVARVAFRDLEHERLTKAKISTVIRAVARWKNVAKLFQDQETLDLIEQMDDELKHLMSGLDDRVKPPAVKRGAKGKKLCQIDNSSLHQLAKQEDINDVLNLYNEFFNVTFGEDGFPLIDPDPLLVVPFGEAVNGADPGVEAEATLTPKDLAHNLGFSDGLPLLFNKFRHLGGLVPWDPQCGGLFDDVSEDVVPIQLHWHQLAGVHSIMRKSFTAQADPSNCTGILLADEVGLGKTFQAGTMIAVLADVVMRQTRKLPLPPVIAENACLSGYKELPQLPHLIVVPGTLLGQWERELKVLLKPASFDIFIYGSGRDNQAFWDPSGPFHKSLHTSNKIIIASHSSVSYDYAKLYQPQRSSRGRLPWAPRSKRPEFDRVVNTTIYGQHYLSITLDEAHEFRNQTKHCAALALVDLCALRLIATATPLQTSNQDSAAMGRLCGIPYFLSEQAYNDEKIDAANLRRAKKESGDLQQDLADDHEGHDQDHLNPLKLCQIEISRRHQKKFEGRIIRRTTKSRDWQNAPVLNLPECETILGLVELTDREKRIITVLSDNVKDDVSTANGSRRISSKSFYIEYRMAVGYAQETKGPIPHFNTLDEWNQSRSTKMDVVARIIRHTLSSDSAPPVNFADGVPIFPQIPPSREGEVPSNKVAIFQDFPSLGPVLRNVLDLYGIKHLYIDGQTSYQNRSKVVQQFNGDPEFRVLIFSSVGSVGLNLARANTIIFLDQPWSAQDERQIRGRVHRQPQRLKVYSYHILATDTADIILSQQARGKRDMMEAFLSKEKGQELYDLFSGRSLPIDEEPQEEVEDIEEDTDSNPKKRRKANPKTKMSTKSARVNLPVIQAGNGQNGNYRGLTETSGTDVELTSGHDTDDFTMRSTSSDDLSMQSVPESASAPTSPLINKGKLPPTRGPSRKVVIPDTPRLALAELSTNKERPPENIETMRERQMIIEGYQETPIRRVESGGGRPYTSVESLFTPPKAKGLKSRKFKLRSPPIPSKEHQEFASALMPKGKNHLRAGQNKLSVTSKFQPLLHNEPVKARKDPSQSQAIVNSYAPAYSLDPGDRGLQRTETDGEYQLPPSEFQLPKRNPFARKPAASALRLPSNDTADIRNGQAQTKRSRSSNDNHSVMSEFTEKRNDRGGAGLQSFIVPRQGSSKGPSATRRYL